MSFACDPPTQSGCLQQGGESRRKEVREGGNRKESVGGREGGKWREWEGDGERGRKEDA